MAALVLLQQGRDQNARSLLAKVRTCVPSADLGLALALAGQVDEAQSVLETAGRQAGADARTRLNLAFVYALQGRWNDAAATAAQDISADQLPGRLHRWAQIAQTAPRSADRVTAMLGIVPQFDPGQPVAIALAPPPSTTWAPLAHAAIPAPAAAAQTIPIVAMAAVEVPARSLPAQAVGQQPRAVTGLPKARIGGRYVVQLGVYYSARQVEAAWARLGGRNSYLATYIPTESNVPSTRANATLHRLSVGGFASQRTAMRLCRLIKSRGGDCFVRGSSGDRPLEWALRSERNPTV